MIEEAGRAPWLPVHISPSPPDQPTRDRIATDLDVSFLVEAGAGSGKTTALLDRMVALLATGRAEINEVAAVTFTKKAASELRERFQIALETGLRKTREAGDDEVVARLDAALRDIERAFIGTIHAFCARLLRERPLDAGLDPAFRELVDVEAEEHRARFWHRYLEMLDAEEDPSLAALVEVGLSPGELEDAFRRLDENRDVEFPSETVARPDPSAVREELDALVVEALRILPSSEPAKGWDRLQQRILRLGYVRKTPDWHDDGAFFDALASVVGWKQGRGNEIQKRWGDDKVSKDRAKALSLRFQDFGAGGGPAARALDRWYAHRYPAVLAFGRSAAEAYAAERRRTGRLSFQDLLMLAARLLRESPAARRQLGERFRYLLVDEFQDTDPVQAEVVFLLSADDPEVTEWTEAVPRPGGLFVVGDPKQSIYRFRRADITIYNLARARFEAFAKDGVGDVLELVANFRSTPAIERFVNDEFQRRFEETATEAQAAYAPLRVQRESTPMEGVWCYDVKPESEARYEYVASEDAERVAAWIDRRITAGERQPGDFLVLAQRRKFLTRYAEALERRNVPVQVTGGEILIEEELRELKLLLEALTDPENPTLAVAVLVGLFFGIDHERLAAHRLDGGSWRFTLPPDGPEGPVRDALGTLHRWWRAARNLPADVSVPMILDELGLLPYAAAGDLGAVRAGALGYFVEAVRQIGQEGDTSLRAAVEALDAVLLSGEAEAPLEPGRDDVVRVMNLHRAKGTEAPVVVLAYPTGWEEFPVSLRVERKPGSAATGWLEVTRPDKGGFVQKVLARPLDWSRHAEEELRFERAERDRQLYVAATRAKEELLVSRCPGRSEKNSFWQPFYACLEKEWTVHGLAGRERDPRRSLDRSAEEILAEIAAVDADRASRKKPSWEKVTVSALAKEGAETAARGRGRGAEWGSAVHQALEAAGRGLEGEDLALACRAALIAWQRPLEPDGEPAELAELVTLVEAVRESEILTRARAAKLALLEVPFMQRREVDGTVQLLEGVIDLAFEEEDGWVIVDWKTDEIEDPVVLDARREIYRRQVDTYAECWEALTGETVARRILHLTAAEETIEW